MKTAQEVNDFDKAINGDLIPKKPLSKGLLFVIVAVIIISSMAVTYWYVSETPENGNENERSWNNITGDAIGPFDAADHIGEDMIVEFVVSDGYKSDTNTVFLNFGDPYPSHAFTAVIFSSDLYKFPDNPHIYYDDKLVRVYGEIELYNGKPQIILNEVTQIEIFD